MKNLNKGWLGIIAAGMVFFVGYVIFTFVETSSGANTEFVSNIQQFQSNFLMSDLLESHLEQRISK
jgi:hypothetical protein